MIGRILVTCKMSGWQDSNLRPPAPKAGAITGLRYTPQGDKDKNLPTSFIINCNTDYQAINGSRNN